ncbi:hypothetical protein FGSG_13702 [Fusarium graminearum PH-1]|uniref:hypothetical protein n=1 Tax=Gibberella zeae (strain ATCC MYA-4620 / CBS 123657 / FGSC 9075 / NRRL 31084 / PH-1) TaxID=229533 RepID=UPI00021F22C7|nr:hypothetical protein FGSG_13702 [Fusarium graminearum PH-1]ESU16766.1 hypothetical protein FGSG_13702 [Fusarium graminearum PH-1]|eukprot:XP_011319028.1 hypothetical protein FGSG_13702 [Fusarium graminearum PH-1]
MASRPFSFVPSWLIFCVTAVLAATNVPNEFSSFIPSCAAECFASFLNVNYVLDTCTGRHLLDCLCPRIGALGFTLGEGAMQCISAERSIGLCSTVEASATLVMDPSGRGVVTFPPVVKSSTTTSLETSTTTQSLPTTLVMDTSSPPVIPRPSTRTRIRSTTKEDISTDSPDETTSASDIISISEPPFTRSTTFETTKSTSTFTSETETTTEAAGGAGGTSKDEDSGDFNKLSTEQIAGISVGVLAAVGVAVGAIVLARYCRRRKYPHVKTGFLPMRDTWGYKADRSDNGGHNSWMVHQLRPDLDPGSQAPPPPTSLGNIGQTSAVRTLAPPAEIVPASAQNKPYGPRPQYPSPFFSSQSHPRRSASSRRSITRPLTRPREDSNSSSATTITTSTESSMSIPSMTLEQQVSLSPVAESPQSVRVRQQQQQQPQIPPRDPRRASQMGNPGDTVNARLAPPSRQIFYSPPGQPSPTLGMMQPPSAYNAARQQPGPQNTQTIPNSGLETTSPTMRIVEPSPEPEDNIADPPAVKPEEIRASPFYFNPPYPQPLQGRQPSQQHRRSASGSQTQNYRPYQRPPSFQPSPREQQAAWQPIQRLHSHHQQQRHQPQQQHNVWHPAQRNPQSYQSFQQQPPLQPYQRPPHSNIYQQQPHMYQSFQARQNQQPQPQSQGGYQSFQPYSTPQQTQIHPSQYQNYRPPQPMTTPLAQSGSQDSLLSKRVGSDRAADMTIGTDPASKSKWNRDVQNSTPPSYPMSPHWQPTLTPTRRGDDLVLNVQ